MNYWCETNKENHHYDQLGPSIEGVYLLFCHRCGKVLSVTPKNRTVTVLDNQETAQSVGA